MAHALSDAPARVVQSCGCPRTGHRGLLAACVVVARRRWQRAQEEVREEDVFKRLQGRRSLGSEYKQSLRDGGSCTLSLGE